jgi:hypothetical protein
MMCRLTAPTLININCRDDEIALAKAMRDK